MREPPNGPAVSVVDLVFAGKTGGGARRLALGAITVLVAYAGVFAVVSRVGRSTQPASAAPVHAAAVPDISVDLPPPPARPPEAASASKAERPRLARAARALRARPAAPAQAGQLAAAAPAPAPADFTGTVFVVGVGSTYVGGGTTSAGTSTTAARGIVAPGGTGDGTSRARSQARAVSLDQSAWSCPWPAEADAQQVNDQTVVLRATVGADGHVARVDLLSDPGFGFGSAARSCAMRTRFEPARASGGEPIDAVSPPIRVHFFR